MESHRDKGQAVSCPVFLEFSTLGEFHLDSISDNKFIRLPLSYGNVLPDTLLLDSLYGIPPLPSASTDHAIGRELIQQCGSARIIYQEHNIDESSQ